MKNITNIKRNAKAGKGQKLSKSDRKKIKSARKFNRNNQ